MQARVLGLLEVYDGDGRLVRVSAPKQRLILAVLLMNINRPVSPPHICEALWGDDPPESAHSVVRTYVSALRRALGATCLEVATTPAGYQLRMDPEELDVVTFERLATEGTGELAKGDPATAATRLQEALSLWRGRPLTDLSASGAVALEVLRLEERRWMIVEDCTDARLLIGDHVQVAAELGSMIAEQPLRERLWAQWMLALYRSGRQTEALAAYRELRRRLVEELGVEPGPPLQRMQQQILAADPALDPPALSVGPVLTEPQANLPLIPRQLPPDIKYFTGRADELARLEKPGKATNTMGIFAIDGMGGIGKSALAVHAAHRLKDLFPDGQLYVNLHGATNGRQPLTASQVLRRFLNALGYDPASVPADVEEASALFRSMAACRRLLVVLDSPHDAEQVRPLLPATSSCVVLVTSRRVLTTLEGAHLIHLDVMPEDEAVTLLAKIGGEQRIGNEPDAAHELVRLCGFLPLAIRVAGARLAARPTWPIRELVGRLADAARRLDELCAGEMAVRTTFDVSLSTLHESADLVDQAAAAAFGLFGLPDGSDLSLGAAARLLDKNEPTTESLLERLVDARLLDCARSGRYRFHALVRLHARDHAAQQHSEEARLTALTRIVAFYTATAWHTMTLLCPDDHRRLATAETRWVHGGLRFPDATTALKWLEAERTNLLAAITQAASTNDIPVGLPTQLARALYWFYRVRGYWRDAIQANRAALRHAVLVDDRSGQAHAYHDLGTFCWQQGMYDDAVAYLQQGLLIYREVGDCHGEAASLNALRIAPGPD